MTHVVPRAVPRRLPFVSAIGLSAFLLFTLELLAARLVLPVFGGSPAVWTTGLCFFTAVLFAGYLYAHLIVTRLSSRTAAVVHLVVAAAAVGLSLAAPADVATLRNPALPEALNVLVALAVVAGGPAFLLAATTPLLSAWYAARGGGPWWLYATSNAASFLGLLAYPLLVEPLVPLSGQRLLFTVGLVALVIVLATVASGARRGAEHRSAVAGEAPRSVDTSSRLPVRRQLLWLAAAFVPAGLLSATTNFLQTDLVSAPLIWVGPLATYLASFVVAFSARGRRFLPVVDKLVPAAATLLWVPFVQPAGWPIIPLLIVELGAFFVVAIAIHGHLAYDLPDEGQVTRFYLVLSAGGLLATAFVALLAPHVFSTVLEYPLLIVAGLVVLALLPRHDPRAEAEPAPARKRESIGVVLLKLGRRLAPYAVISGILIALIARQDPGIAQSVLRFVLLGAIVVLVAVSPRLLAVTTAVVLIAAVIISASSPLLRVRTFFGVIEVRQSDAAHIEVSGTTVHGVQFTDERRVELTSYYVKAGPFGDAYADLTARTSSANIGVIGLGVGTLAAYMRPDDTMTFYEIDQAVIDIANDRRWFSYLADAPQPPRVVLGDARLSIVDEPAATFDLLVLDAFSSDSVPAHLLTREAIQAYMRTLRPGGMLLFHLSNRYYDLGPAVATTAHSVGLTTAMRGYSPTPELAKRLQAGPTLVLVAGAAADVARFSAVGWTPPGSGPLLTDDYSDLLRTLRITGLGL